MTDPTPTPTPTAPPAPTVSFLQILTALLGDAPDIAAFVNAFEAALAAEKTATTFTARVNAAIPVLQQAAALADKLKTQI